MHLGPFALEDEVALELPLTLRALAPAGHALVIWNGGVPHGLVLVRDHVIQTDPCHLDFLIYIVCNVWRVGPNTDLLMVALRYRKHIRSNSRRGEF